MGSRRNGRIIAFQAIYSWEMNANPFEDILDLPWIDKSRCYEDSLVFAKLLVNGTLQNIKTIDSQISRQILNWDFNRLSRVDLAILRISVFSLLYQKDIPPSVTIDEAINIAREFGSDESYKFINGVLDGIRKKNDND